MKTASLLVLLFLATGCEPADRAVNQLPDLYGDMLPEHAVGRLGTVRFRPQASTVSQLAYSPDGRYLATVSSSRFGAVDAGMQIWDANTGRSIGLDELVHVDLRCMAWGPDSSQFAVCHDTGAIEIWSLAEQQRIRTLADKDASYVSLAWSSDGKWIAAGRESGPLTVFAAATGKASRSFDHSAKSVDFSSDSKLLAGVSTGHVKIWEVATGALRHKVDLKTTPDDVNYSIDFSPDGKRLAVAGDRPAVIDISQPPPQIAYLSGELACSTIAFSPDGTKLVTAGLNYARFWDAETKQHVHRLSGTTGSAYGAAFSPGGKTLAMSCARLKFFDASSGAARPDEKSGHTLTLLDFALAPDGKTAFTIDVGPTIRQWDVQSCRQTRELNLPSGNARSVAVSRDGAVLAVAEGSRIHLFDCRSGDIIAVLDEHQDVVASVVFSPTEDLLVSRSIDGEVRFWNSAEHYCIEVIDLGLDDCYGAYATFSGNGRRLAMVSPMHSQIDLIDPFTHSMRGSFRVRKSLALILLPLDISPQGKTIALLSVTPGPRIELQDFTTGDEIRKLEGSFSRPEAIAFAPQGDLIAVADSLDKGDSMGRVIRIFSAATGKQVARFLGHWDHVRRLTFSPDGAKLFSASQDTTVLIWSLDEARAALQGK